MVTRTQLLSAGFDKNAIDHQIRTGRLIRIHRGVYAVGHRPPSPHARAMAAVLACGPGAALSHRSAAALWGLGRAPHLIDVTARTDHRVNDVRVHRSRTLTPGDITHHYGIPVTTPHRTLRDLHRVLDPASLTRAINEARLAHLIKDSRTPTRSVLEDAFLAFLDRHGLPRPEVNQIVAGYEVDMLWRDQRLIAELDGRAFHQDFEADRDRDADLVTAGFKWSASRTGEWCATSCARPGASLCCWA